MQLLQESILNFISWSVCAWPLDSLANLVDKVALCLAHSFNNIVKYAEWRFIKDAGGRCEMILDYSIYLYLFSYEIIMKNIQNFPRVNVSIIFQYIWLDEMK